MVASSMRAMGLRPQVVRFAILYAVVLTSMHVADQLTPSNSDFSFLRELLDLVGPAAMRINAAGEVLGAQIGYLYQPDYDSTAWLVWLATFKFAGSFVEAAALGWLGMLSWRLRSTGRFRAVAYPLGTALITWAAFRTGAAHYWQECRDTGGGDCDLGWDAGMVWSAIAFGGCIAFIALVEALGGKVKAA